MRNNNTAFVAAGLGVLLAAALFPGVRYGALPMPAGKEVAAPVLPAGSDPVRPSAARLCFHGPEGDLLALAPAGQPCP